MNRSKAPRRPSTSVIYPPVFREYIDNYGEVVKTSGREQHKLTATFFQVHDNIFELHCKINLLSIHLLNYFGRVMGENSIIHFNRFEKKEFITFIKEHGGKEYKIGSIDNALLDLKKVEAITALDNATLCYHVHKQ
jgi:hypothetical protein